MFAAISFVIAASALAAPAQPVPSNAGATLRPSADFLIGRWTDNNDCSDAVDFRSDGRFVSDRGSQGRWSLGGDRLTFHADRIVTVRVVVVDQNKLRLEHSNGSVGRSTRCPAASAGRQLPELPESVEGALAISQPATRADLVGRWADNPSCTRGVVTYSADGSYSIPGGTGRWTLEGDQLVLAGLREARTRVRKIGTDRLILIFPDNGIAQSLRC